MLQLKIENEVFAKQINQSISALKELTSTQVLQEIAKAAFVISGEKFVNAIDRESVKNPKAFHHVYEWGKLGSPDGRLFYLQRERILGGNLEINSVFKPSRVPVPKDSQYTKSSKSLSSKNIFRYKAAVMESGKPVSFVTRSVTPLSGLGEDVFVAPGTRIDILNPGGVQTKNSFSKFMVDWYVRNLDMVMETSGLYERIEREVARIANTNTPTKSQIRSAVSSIVNSVTQGKDRI